MALYHAGLRREPPQITPVLAHPGKPPTSPVSPFLPGTPSRLSRVLNGFPSRESRPAADHRCVHRRADVRAARLFPGLDFEMPWRLPVCALLFIAGAGLDMAGLVHFLKARTTVNPLDPAAATSLVTSGLYRLTRNPMYLGFALLLLAWGNLS